MKRNLKIASITFIALLLLACNENPVNWSHIFDSRSKEPFGTYVLRKELDSMFALNDIYNINLKTSEYFNPTEQENIFDFKKPQLKQGTYLYIHEKIVLDSISQIAIDNFVKHGSAAFIASYNIPKHIPIFRNISIVKPFQNGTEIQKTHYKKKVSYKVTLPKVDSLSTTYSNILQAHYFTNIPEEAVVIGTVTLDNQEYPNFIKIPNQNGYYFLHAEPFAFTNFEMLQNNHANYVANALSVINEDDIYWDNDRIYERIFLEKQSGEFWNLFSFFMNHKSLKMAIILIFFGIIVFLLFNSSRRQNPIPWVATYENSQIEYAKVLTHLYGKNTNHKSLLQYKINFLLDEIRKKYHLNTNDLSEKFTLALSQKSNVQYETCESIVRKIKYFQSKKFISKEEYLDTAKLINPFLYLPKKTT